MVRRSVGFVSKKPHRKSRGGCFTCKRKKVKCDEGQPGCGYCSLRKLSCEYVQDPVSSSPSSTIARGSSPSDLSDFNDMSSPMTSWLLPAAQAASGTMSGLDFELLHHYKTFTWQTLTARDDSVVTTLHGDILPQLSLSQPHLFYALLSVASSHSSTLVPRKEIASQALVYRQKTFSEYSKALQNITSENYESVLATGLLLLGLIPIPAQETETDEDEAYLIWMDTFLRLSEGLRILAGLRWQSGIEKMSVYPLICRELRTLPPTPILHHSDNRHLHPVVGAVGATPDHPNPPSTYYMQHSEASPVFLPPSLMRMMASLRIAESRVGPIDWHGNALYPVLHAFSPIFLSLYYYHLNPDFFCRVFVFCSFLMSDFQALARDREPRALVLVTWWLALAGLAPNRWWLGQSVEKVTKAVGRIVVERGDEVTKEAFRAVENIIRVSREQGSESAARSVFDEWVGMDWDEGPIKAEEWEADLMAVLSSAIQGVEIR